MTDYAILALDLDGVVTSWNEGAERMTGYCSSEIVGRNFSVFYLPEEVAAGVPEAELAATAANGSVEAEGWRVRENGSRFWANVVITAHFDDKQQLTGFAKLTRDISALKRQSEQSAEEHRRLRNAEAIGHIGSWELDLDTRAVTWSEQMYQLYGIDPDDTLEPHKFDVSMIHLDDREMFISALGECERSGPSLWCRYRVTRRNDGKLRWFEAYGERLPDGQGTTRIIGSVIDVSEQVWAREIMERARDDALEASSLKSSFLANMSHEIRTPMNGVIGMTGLLLDTDLDIVQRDFVDTIRASGEALLVLINDILDFSKIESDELDIECGSFDLCECMETALAVVAATGTTGIELLGQLDDHCAPVVLGDVTRLRQVLVNLVGNAVKFTQRGTVLLTIEPDLETPGKEKVRLSVRDTGIGIPADRLATLFDAYSQVDSSTNRLHGGTGLGLAISDRLVRAMGGSIAVESVVGQGSTFSFSIALPSSPELSSDTFDCGYSRLKDRTVLIVDDNPISRRTLRYQLEGWGMRVTDTVNAPEAVALVATGAHFDVGLVDMRMPEMTGEELAESLDTSEVGKTIPLILVSACRWQLTRSDLFTAILAKPVGRTRLWDSLVNAIWPSEADGDRRAVTEVRSEQDGPMRVLLVEDNNVNQRVGRLILEKLGHRVDLAGNGVEAVHAVNLVPYDAVFMDIQMPEMNGFDATLAIRETALPFRQPYLIALTANATVEDRRRSLEAGMDEFLTKPIRLADFEAALQRIRAHS